MSAFATSILTDAGWDQLASALAGGNLDFVRMEAGDGTVVDDNEIMGMTALKNKIMDIPITSYSDDGKGQLTLIGTLSSKNVTTAFWFRELGVIATVGSGPETLYAASNSYALADYIPDSTNPAVVIQNLEIVVKIDRATNVTVNLSLGANVTAENIGPATVGAGWFRDKLNNILNFKRFVSTVSVKISETTDTIRADAIIPPAIPVGCMMDYPSMTPPTGWLNCDGAAISRTGFPALFLLLGIQFGSGDGSTTFNLPDFRGRTSIGAGSGPGLTARNIAEKGGIENTVLTIAQLPAHNHYVNDPTHAHGYADWGHGHGLGDPGHAHSVYDPQHSHPAPTSTNWNPPDHSPYDYNVQYVGSAMGGIKTEFLGFSTQWKPTGIGIYGAGTGMWIGASGIGIAIYGAATGIWLNDTGGGQAHSNMQPYLVINKIIKI